MSEVEPTHRWSREYPQRPIVGVAGVVLDGDRVLLIRRGRAPGLGTWSLPGGALRVGERMVEGVAREVWEETGLRVEVVEQVATLDRLVHDTEGRVQFHYVLLDWLCRITGVDRVPVPGSDAAAARWVDREDLRGMAGLDDVAMELIERVMEREKIRA